MWAGADVLACDHSSIMFEWAACGRPVVVLEQPWFGGHDAQPHPWPLRQQLGPVVREATATCIEAAVAEARTVHPIQALMREAAVAATYTHLDGAAALAADWIRRTVDAVAP